MCSHICLINSPIPTWDTGQRHTHKDACSVETIMNGLVDTPRNLKLQDVWKSWRIRRKDHLDSLAADDNLI